MRALVAAMAVLALCCAAPARAVEDRDDAALQHLDTGVAAYRAGDYATARREFEAAQHLVPDKADPYRWLGLTYVQLGDCTHALLAFETFLQRVPPGDERVSEVTRARDGCEHPPSALTAPAPPSLVAPAPAVAASAPPPRKPLARRWWFWTALGGAAAVTAAGITLGVVLGSPRETRLPPIVCGTTGCAGSM